MNSYIFKPKIINSTIFKENEFALSPFNYRETKFKNKNSFSMGELLSENLIKGFEPGTKSYINFSDNYFIRISELDDLNFTFDVSEDTKKIIPPSSSEDIVLKYDVLYQTASNEGNVCVYIGDKPAYYNSHLRKLILKKDKFYILAILKSNVGKQQVEVLGSIKGMDNFKDEYLLNTKIPYPTKANHNSPETIKFLISEIVQNIIDKEEQIRRKNIEIDKMIETEIKKNQKEDKFTYKYPTINAIKSEGRMDTVLFVKEYRDLEFLIKNYKDGFFYLNEDQVSPGKTPKDYYYTDKKLANTYQWITPKNISKRHLLYKTYLYTKKVPNTTKYSLIFTGVRYVGNCFFVEDDKEPIYCNQNTLVINYSKNITDQLYLMCFLSSDIGRKLQIMQRINGIVPILYTADFIKIPIPNFSENKRKDIAKLYYNSVQKQREIKLENYLESEKQNNKILGIYQLNLDVLKLRDKLNGLIDKIVKEEQILIDIAELL